MKPPWKSPPADRGTGPRRPKKTDRGHFPGPAARLAASTAQMYNQGRMKESELGYYERIAVRAVQEALHNRLLEDFWDHFKEVFNRPDVQKAATLINRAIAESFLPPPEPLAPPRKGQP